MSACRVADGLDEALVHVRSRGREARDDLHLAAAQAGRDLEALEPVGVLGQAQRLGDLRLRDPVEAEHLLAQLDRPGDGRAEGVGRHRGRPHGVQLARRAGEHDHGRPAVDRHDEAGRGAHRLEDGGARGHDGLLAVGGADRVGVEVGPARHQRAQDLGDALLERLVEDHLAPGERAHHLGREVVRGRPQPAAGHDQVDVARGQEAQRLLHVLAAVAHDQRVGVVDAERAQLLGQPWPVAVGHAAREDLGARDDDAGVRAHAVGQRGHCDAGRRRILRGVIS